MGGKFFKSTARDTLLNLNSGDQLFISALNKPTFNENEFFTNQLSSCNLDFIVKIAHASKEFELLCDKDAYYSLWSTQFQLIGGYLSQEQDKPIILYEHPDESSFDLLRGAYFFYRSQQELATSKTDYSLDERLFLKEAVQLNSVHAIQRYNQYLYSQVEQTDLDVSEKLSLLNEAKDNCKKVLQTYGSYAYLMLAEAYFRCALFYKEINSDKNASSAFKAATKSCDLANKYMEKSECSIHNASLGKGLQYSNSLMLETPCEVKEYITEYFINNTAESNKNLQKNNCNNFP